MGDNDLTSAGDSKDKDSPAYLKRREQVRRAQRSHRERKETYIKSLENEVLQLRTHKAQVLGEVGNLRNEIRRLRQVLDRHGIFYDNPQETDLSTYALEPPSSSGLSSISLFPESQAEQQLHGRNRLGESGNEVYSSESEGNLSIQSSIAPFQSTPYFSAGTHSDTESFQESSVAPESVAAAADCSAITASAANLKLGDIDQNALGMDFILTLESPCLNHLQTERSASNTTASTGHALTASAPLLFQSPTQAVPTAMPEPPYWSNADISLDNLLSLSNEIDLNDEITPVQAWNQICSHRDFASVEIPRFRRFTEDAVKHVKCYGFGSVIDTSTFASLSSDLFPKRGSDPGLDK